MNNSILSKLRRPTTINGEPSRKFAQCRWTRNRRRRIIPHAGTKSNLLSHSRGVLERSDRNSNREKSQLGSPGYPLICVPTGTDKEMARLVPVRTGKGR